MKRTFLWVPLLLAACAETFSAAPVQLPEFTHDARADWINSTPLTRQDLANEVVLIEFWTFDCINCRRTLPWLKSVHADYAAQGLKIVSVHTPELPRERDPVQVRAAVERLGITWPVLLDNDFSYWRALRNRYWPAFYLVGRDGKIAATAIGELHRGQRHGDEFEAQIRQLLNR